MEPYNDAKVTHNQVNEGHSASGVGYPLLLRNVPNEVLSYIFVLCSCGDPGRATSTCERDSYASVKLATDDYRVESGRIY
jgi:hypothetical protein